MKKNIDKALRNRLIILGVLAVFCFLATFLDKWIAAAIPQHPLLTYLFGWVSHYLTVVFILLIMTSLFMWEEKHKEWILPLWVSFMASLVISIGIKFLVARERPGELLTIFGIADYSFPSSHAAVAFSVVALLDAEYPKLKWFWVGFATVICVSRIALGVHWVSDVLGGALLGYGISVGVLYYCKKYGIV